MYLIEIYDDAFSDEPDETVKKETLDDAMRVAKKKAIKRSTEVGAGMKSLAINVLSGKGFEVYPSMGTGTVHVSELDEDDLEES